MELIFDDDALETALRELSEREGRPPEEVARSAILERHRAAEHTRLVDEATDRMAGKWDELLGRLKDT
ncbi:hypothetical protein [Flexivirga meconopsidis]|uniref:hypothetical protein n=1 Tax=Flexivirga meconopsidis TaxID=2977121 RepID=UPI00223EF5F1|nr:hypothetical protein [Flexivirga meconopsidis]